jgi:hypothetical protein
LTNRPNKFGHDNAKVLKPVSPLTERRAMLTHIVFFKLNDRTPENAEKLREVLQSMIGQIPQIKHMEVGVNIVPSERAYDVALYQHFDALPDLQAYQAHPNHQDVLKYILSVTASRVSVDYES